MLADVEDFFTRCHSVYGELIDTGSRLKISVENICLAINPDPWDVKNKLVFAVSVHDVMYG